MNIVERGSTSLKVEWEEQYQGATYTLELSRNGIVVLTADTTELSFTFQDLPPQTEYTIKLSTEPEQKYKYETILLEYTGVDGPIYFGVPEVQVYDGEGNYMTKDKFTLTQSSTFTNANVTYSADRSMNGLYENWRDGAMTTNSVRPWWKASLNTPSEIERIVFYFPPHGSDLENMGNTTLTLEGETTTTVKPAGVREQTIYI